MPILKDSLLKGIPLRHIWIFITDRCNLACDYCFFSDRKHKDTFCFSQLACLIKQLSRDCSYDFVISGGEPLLNWKLTHRFISTLRLTFPKSYITLQTNIFFLTQRIVNILKQQSVTVEPGIDGAFLSNYRHRKGFTKPGYRRCLEKIGLLVRENCNINPTMTVHPREAGYMVENFNKLLALGLHSIDVHPAFLADWDARSCRVFLDQYRTILKIERKSGKYLLCKSYSVPIKLSFDMIVQPDGFVLPNWTFLAFPCRIRKKFFIFHITSEGLKVFPEVLLWYLKKLKLFFRKERTYRDFSNFNAVMVVNRQKNPEVKSKFISYKRLCERIQRLDKKFMTRRDLAYDYPLR